MTQQNMHVNSFGYIRFQIIFVIILLIIKMQAFIEQFFNYRQPIPNITPFTLQQMKTLKLILQFSTATKLSRKIDKQGNINFFCKQQGKQCYHIRIKKQKQQYFIIDDYHSSMHKKLNCHYNGEMKLFFQTYCLLQLRINEIKLFMQDNNLMQSQPSDILIKYSNNNKYFYQYYIHKIEYKKMLKKKFDNIINIDIKKKMYQNLQEQNKKNSYLNTSIPDKTSNKMIIDENICCQRGILCQENNSFEENNILHLANGQINFDKMFEDMIMPVYQIEPIQFKLSSKNIF